MRDQPLIIWRIFLSGKIQREHGGHQGANVRIGKLAAATEWRGVFSISTAAFSAHPAWP